IERMNGMLQSMLNLGAVESLSLADVDLNDIVFEALRFVSDECQRGGIAVEASFDPRPLRGRFDATRVMQVIHNLLLNAIEAMAATPPAQRTLRIVTEREDARSVRLSVADSGEGLSAQAQAHLFDAFWTTKQGGIGIGLSISRSIVEAGGGRIWAEPGRPRGAVFCVCLPTASGARP
ncbi:MAG: ATP-binding protein, partial [Xanthomonas sp.]